ERIDADADHVRTDLVQFGGRIAKRAHLSRADAAEGRGEEREHDGPFLELRTEADLLTVLVRQGEVRRLGANGDGHSMSPVSSRSGRINPGIGSDDQTLTMSRLTGCAHL